MHYADFPLGMRVLLAATAVLCLVGGIFVFVGVTAIVALLSDTGIHPALWGVFGTILGSLGTLFIQRYIAGLNRRREANDVTATLHAEISDRAARLLNDYLIPWKAYRDDPTPLKEGRTRTNINKFRPVSAVAYPAVASKMGLLNPEALFRVTQFYFRFGVVQREIDDLLEEKIFDEKELGKVRKRYAVVTGRLQEALGPALLALESLKVANATTIEDAAAKAYPHVDKTGLSLREGLRANQKMKP